VRPMIVPTVTTYYVFGSYCSGMRISERSASIFGARRLSQQSHSFPSPEKVPTRIHEGVIRAEHDVAHHSNCVFSPYSPNLVEKLFGNSEWVPNGAPKAAKMGRRSPDRPTAPAKEVRSRRLQLFSKQFQKVNSANFALTEFYEVRVLDVLGR
jgi:hypothetical protein